MYKYSFIYGFCLIKIRYAKMLALEYLKKNQDAWQLVVWVRAIPTKNAIKKEKLSASASGLT